MLQSPAETIRLEQALVRLEQAMAAASRMSGERVAGSAPATALEADGVPPQVAEGNTRSAGVVESRKPPPDVARLEDVLTVASPPSTPTPPAAPVKAPLVGHRVEREPSYVDAQSLREAFWFEQASARQALSDAVEAVLAATEPNLAETEPTTTSVGPPVAAAEPTATSVAPPVAAAEPTATSVAPPAAAASPHPTPSVVRLWAEEPSRTSWGIALCLLALIALVVMLTGRAFRRLGGHRHS